jgi:NitT/TauT family transport system ATP-binding protein
VSDASKAQPHAGEAGTVAVTVDRPRSEPTWVKPDQSGPMPRLRVKDLSHTYVDRTGKGVDAVRDIAFDVVDKPAVGEIIVFLGPSGCGKSTILKAVAGLITPTRGEVFLDGKLIEEPGRDRGMVFQAYTSFSWLTVRQNVEYGLKLHGVGGAERKKLSQKYLEEVGLADFADRFPKDLSGGMKQRVAIARTLINKPRVVLMDEPFGALDPQTRWGMQSLLLDVSRHEDNTTLFVTHDVSEAVYVADSVYVLSARPARVLHRVDVPFFQQRDAGLKSTRQFREIEERLLDLLYAG